MEDDCREGRRGGAARQAVLRRIRRRDRWSGTDGEGAGARRKVVVLRSEGGASLVVLDGDMPTSMRAIASDSDMKRDTTLSLLEAEDFNGPAPLAATETLPVRFTRAISPEEMPLVPFES